MATKKKAAKAAKKKSTSKKTKAGPVDFSPPPAEVMTLAPRPDGELPCCRICGGEMKSNICPGDGFHLVDAP